MELKKLEGGFFVNVADATFYRRDFKDGTLVPSSQEAYAAWLNKNRLISSIEWSEWDGDVPFHIYESRSGKFYWFIEEGMITLFKENTSTSEGVGYEGAQYSYSTIDNLEKCPKLIGHKETLLALKIIGVDFSWVNKSIDLLGIWQASPDLINYDGKSYDLSIMIDEYGEKYVSIKQLKFGSQKPKSPLAMKAIEVEDEDIF